MLLPPQMLMKAWIIADHTKSHTIQNTNDIAKLTGSRDKYFVKGIDVAPNTYLCSMKYGAEKTAYQINSKPMYANMLDGGSESTILKNFL